MDHVKPLQSAIHPDNVLQGAMKLDSVICHVCQEGRNAGSATAAACSPSRSGSTPVGHIQCCHDHPANMMASSLSAAGTSLEVRLQVDPQLAPSYNSGGRQTESESEVEAARCADIEKGETSAAAAAGAAVGSSVLDDDVAMLKERFAKLLLGEDLSGGGKGVSTALAISNAITNVSASIFGDLRKLEPLPTERKLRWRQEMDRLLVVTDYIVEYDDDHVVASNSLTEHQQQQHLAGSVSRINKVMQPEYISVKPRKDLHIYLPALKKLDTMLIDALDSFVQTDFWYSDPCNLSSKKKRRGRKAASTATQQQRVDILEQMSISISSSSGSSRRSMVDAGGPAVRLRRRSDDDDEEDYAEDGYADEDEDEKLQNNGTEADLVDEEQRPDDAEQQQQQQQAHVERWWVPSPKVRAGGLSADTRKHLQHLRESVNQILKAALAVNAQTLAEMKVPTSYMDSLPKNGRTSLGEQLYRTMKSEKFSATDSISCIDPTQEHSIVDLMNNVEAALHIWKRKVEAIKRAQAESRSDNIQLLRGTFQIREARLLGLEKRQMLMERAESFLFLLRLKFPGMPQTILDVSKIQYCKDVGHSILESYSRVLESLAYNIRSRIDDVLNADDIAKSDPPSNSISRISILTSQADNMIGGSNNSAGVLSVCPSLGVSSMRKLDQLESVTDVHVNLMN